MRWKKGATLGEGVSVFFKRFILFTYNKYFNFLHGLINLKYIINSWGDKKWDDENLINSFRREEK